MNLPVTSFCSISMVSPWPSTGFRAINSLALTILPGEMRAIIGPNGAGKTTMMDIITGKTKPDTGDVLFNGTVDLTQLDEAAIANLGIGRKFQKPTVFEMHSVEDNLRLALKADRRVFRTLFWRDNESEREKIARILATIRLEHLREASAASLSHGRSNGSKSACCWRRTRSCSWWTSRSRA